MKWKIGLVLLAIVAIFGFAGFNYFNPEVGKFAVNKTEVKRVDTGEVDASGNMVTKDVYQVTFVRLETGTTKVMQIQDSYIPGYRWNNRSGDWYGWLAGKEGTKEELKIMYYGWRSGYFDWYYKFDCVLDENDDCMEVWDD